MGHAWIEVEISDLERRHTERAKALIDTGATPTVIPKELADKAGIKAVSGADVESGGGIIKLKKGEARIKIKDKEGVTPVLISETIDKVLIGGVVLESLGFVVDPVTETLKPSPLLLYSLPAK